MSFNHPTGAPDVIFDSVEDKEDRQVESTQAQDYIGKAFIHSDLDEYGLDPYEFRVYGHIVRRTSSRLSGQAFASVKKMAESCKMSPRKVQYALKFLCEAGLLIRQEVPNKRTNTYQLAPVKQWAHKRELDAIRASIQTSKSQKTEAKKK